MGTLCSRTMQDKASRANAGCHAWTCHPLQLSSDTLPDLLWRALTKETGASIPNRLFPFTIPPSHHSESHNLKLLHLALSCLGTPTSMSHIKGFILFPEKCSRPCHSVGFFFTEDINANKWAQIAFYKLLPVQTGDWKEYFGTDSTNSSVRNAFN
jgi:hypothetical protein